MRRAYRREVTNDEVGRVMRLAKVAVDDGGSFEDGIRLAVQAVLISPHFLFRWELDGAPENPKAIRSLNELELASRLSFFLWSSMPDDRLLELAGKAQLRKNLKQEISRMLSDKKAEALVGNFAGQWLQLRNLDVYQPDKKLFPMFTPELRAAMRHETEQLFSHIALENHSVLEILSADYSFLNERLAGFYGISGVKGNSFRRVSLRGIPRGGILTHASVLTITSDPNRTSPVKRGKYVLENILGRTYRAWVRLGIIQAPFASSLNGIVKMPFVHPAIRRWIPLGLPSNTLMRLDDIEQETTANSLMPVVNLNLANHLWMPPVCGEFWQPKKAITSFAV